LKALSRREGVTLFMTLLAAFQVVLGRYFKQDDVVIGTDVANRNRLETEWLMGFFVNQLVLRVKLGGNPTFKALLRQVREVTLGAYAHQDLPFEKLVEELAPARDLSTTPLFQVKMIFQNMPVQQSLSQSRGDLSGPTVEYFHIKNQEAKFNLVVIAREDEGRLTCNFKFSQNAFSQSEMELLASELQELLGILTTQDKLSLGLLSAKLDQFDARYRESRKTSMKKAFETSLSQRRPSIPVAGD
jgi:non-ribosomal peptide synthetase component F